MIRYYCKICNQYLDKEMRDRDENKCRLCKSKLAGLEEQVKKTKNLDLSKKLTIERKKFANNYVKTASKIYWCKIHNIPLYEQNCSLCKKEESKGKYIATDIRPVFYEERLLLAALVDDESFINKSVWSSSSNKYIVNGQVLPFSKSDLMKNDSSEVIKKLNLLENKYQDLLKQDFTNNEFIQLFIKANETRFKEIDTDAIQIIKDASKGYNSVDMFISFSGGKDSTVVLDLVTRAFSDNKIIKLFGDTTLEFKDTYDYIKRLKADPRNHPIFSAKNIQDDFFELCKFYGPPSRVMRWCCTYFKIGPISNRIDSAFSNKNILSFQGIRRNESINRNSYKQLDEGNSKIAKQKVCSPILDWLDFDIWLYILNRKIDFNHAYKRGFTRVGCWVCPNNGKWAEYLTDIYMPQKSKKWKDALMTFADETNKVDPESYVAGGYWKARQGGAGLEISQNNIISFKPCATEKSTFNYELTRPITEQLYDFFKPFGYLDTETGNKRLGEIYILAKNETPILRIQGRKGSTNLRVTVMDVELFKKSFNTARKKQLQSNTRVKNLQDIKNKIECQITKFQTCTGCSGCTSTCKYDAIKIRKDINKNSKDKINSPIELLESIDYRINDNICTRCTACIDHFDNGCYMKKVLRIKRSE